MNKLIELLRKLQWVRLPFGGSLVCPVCQVEGQHATDCELGCILAAYDDASSDGVLLDLSEEATYKLRITGGYREYPNKEFLHIGKLKLLLTHDQMDQLYKYFGGT